MADCRSLEGIANRIRPVVDKVIAHRERRPRGLSRVTLQEMHAAIQEIDQVCVRYAGLLNQEGSRTMLPVDLEVFDNDIKAVWGGG